MPLAAFVVFCAAALDERLWGWIGIYHIRPYFADTVAILAAGDAQRAGLDIYSENPFDPLGRPHVYGPGWLIAGGLGLTVNDAIWLGPLLIAVFLITAALVINPGNVRAWGFGAIALTTPPVLLALERANNDLVVFVLLAAAAAFVSRGRWGSIATGSGLLLVGAALKIYPLAGLAILAGVRRRRILVINAVAVALIALAYGWVWRADFRQALSLSPRPNSIFVYGVRMALVIWQSLFATRIWLITGAVLAAAACGLWVLRRPKELWRFVPQTGLRAHCFAAGATSWLLCYALASNYAYRLVLILLPAVLWIAEERHQPAARNQLVGWIVVGWLFTAKRWLASAALDSHDSRAEALLSLLVGFDQVLVAGLSLALAIALAGWFWRCRISPGVNSEANSAGS